jgi:hypothetical protein
MTETGVAIAQSAETGHHYAVQMFGRPKDMMIEFEVANQTKQPVEYRFADRRFEIGNKARKDNLRNAFPIARLELLVIRGDLHCGAPNRIYWATPIVWRHN